MTKVVIRKRKPLPEEVAAKICRPAPDHYAEEIATECLVPLPDVYAVLRRTGLAAKPKKADPWKNRRDADGKPPVKPPGLKEPKAPPIILTPIEAAKRVFGNRLSITSDRMTLDGWDIGLNKLMQKVNEKHVAWGEEQRTENPAWCA